MTLTGKRALVTGAGRGAGEGIALALANAGADVAVCDLDEASSKATAAAIAEKGVKSLGLRTDVSSEDDVQAMIDATVAEFGGIDILVNTVAWIDPPGPIASMPYERWRTGIRINLDSVFLCSKAALAVMQKSGGLIVNVSSVNGTRGFPNRAVYGATKAAILNLTETLFMENREYGVRVNCLVPGGISGGIRGRILGELAAQEGVDFFPKDFPTFDPPLRSASPLELGEYVVFLAGPAGEAINGQCLWMGEAPRWGGQVLL